jgi:cell division transport system permease protein
MTIIVLAITISLAGIFYSLVINLQQLSTNLESSNQISLFLKADITQQQAEQLANTIKQNESIANVSIINKDQALAEFKQYSGFGSALNALDKNPLPIVVQVLPKESLNDIGQFDTILNNLKNFVEVDFAQMDMLWIKRLQSMLAVASRIVDLLNIVLAFAVVFIIGNTIRLELQSRRDEVEIAKLVGATHSFIQRPFLYSGFWLGFISGVSAWLIVTIIMLLLREPVETLSNLYQGTFHLLFFSTSQTLFLIFSSSALGVIGSWAVIHHQLHQLKPQ